MSWLDDIQKWAESNSEEPDTQPDEEFSLEAFIKAGQPEQPAEVRQAAQGLYSLYMALMEAGFPEERAFQLVLQMVQESL
jgi:hypothetical protein